ncbi:WD repeat and FYVE domain-containing protein 3 [Neocloeon triangulifer]|uniref:WD repeat and FYVE domain-containing protein 3 n=1 Tax=Neocloeon triangulifer TaxID=2078957 RepID=UPI00286F4768|nr:WD repeat and FYVE domain-containing protein 3 [Neocloeon triangulifer]
MNIMRKLARVGGGSSASTTASAAQKDDPNQNSQQHMALGLMHLKKLFSEFIHPSHPLNEKERDDKLYNMLPLFCKVFGTCSSHEMVEKFRDVHTFCTYVSKLMVSEIRKRASNQSTESASCAIAKFLEIENSENTSNGWMLLTALNLLAEGELSLIQAMTVAALPSTLVKCLYLFFDLPEMENENVSEPGSEFTPCERRVLLQKIFVQLLVRLCSHPPPAEELARKDDLALLFSAITSWCPAHNAVWRKSAAEVLMTISRHGLSQQVVAYIHSKGCISLCIDNMQRVTELSPLEVVEMFVTVFCFLKDSSEVAQSLLDDFKSCQGYQFISEFLLKLEQDEAKENQDAIRNLVLLLASLTMCGHNELQPSQASVGSLFRIMGFLLPQPAGRGASVRNIQAFQVLQSVFLKATSSNLCCTILDAISSVYHADNANYFILEGQNTLPQFAEKIHLKPMEIQEKFFHLLEFIVFQLNFVPCKELISLSIILRDQYSIPCSITCMQTLKDILKHNIVFKDVYREVGLLEVFATCLERYAALIRDASGDKSALSEEQITLGIMTIEALITLLSGNANNAAVFRESGGAKCVHNLVQFKDCRQEALTMVKELILTTGGDEDLGILLATMHSAPHSNLELKSDILKSLLTCLRESHRTRTVFRKVGGFVYVMSVLVSMEGSLQNQPADLWRGIKVSEVLSLLHLVFNTVSVAMRFEPANAKFFQQEICFSTLCDSIRLLGCFSSQKTIPETSEDLPSPNQKDESIFQKVFTGNVLNPAVDDNIPRDLTHATILLRMLYDLALDLYDKVSNNSHANIASIAIRSPRRHVENSHSAKKNVANLNLTPPPSDPIIVHPGVVVAMLHLLPSIQCQDVYQSLTLQVFCSEVLKSLVRSERNQQVMCEAGMPGELLRCCAVALEEETHPLHPSVQYMLERLAAQTLEAKDLRSFLRLGEPLNTLAIEDFEAVNSRKPSHRKPGGPVPLTRIKTLVSMTTPRDFRLHGASILPPFVEFDMSAEGFGCLFLPSLAPQSSNIQGAVTSGGQQDINVVGGIGAGDRIFPPAAGLTFSTWMCVDKYSDPRTDPHCVRLLTIVRHIFGKEDPLACLTFVLSARDKAIIVSTQEISVPHNVGEWEPDVCGDGSSRVWCPDLLQEGQWHHIVLAINRQSAKNSSFSIFVDGQHIHTQKMHYIAQNPGGGSANLHVPSSVYGFIGTPPSWRKYSRLSWKQGPCQLIEEVLSPQMISIIHRLGPQYMGSLQAPEINHSESHAPLIAEEKLMFGLNSKAVSQLTLAKIRKVYSRADNRAIAKQLGMSSHENATPIRVLHNSAGHLSGPARTLGGVVIGYLGVRVFSPRPVAKMVESVGGCNVLLGLIAMAKDVESLYAAVKALVCVVKSSQSSQQEMDRKRGYQMLATLLRRKKPLLNSHILHLAFSLVGTVDSGRESSSIPNVAAYRDLLGDLDVWYEAPGDLTRSLFEHHLELIAESSEKKTNLKIARELNLLPKLLRILLTAAPNNNYNQCLLSLIAALLANSPRPHDLLVFGQAMASTLSVANAPTEKLLTLTDVQFENNDNELNDILANIILRNKCLQILHSLLFLNNKVCMSFCDEVTKTLGFDWVLLFLQGHLHPTTVVWGLRILVVLNSCPNLIQRFRDGTHNGGWLKETESVNNQIGMLAGYQIGSPLNKSGPQSPKLTDLSNVHGFQRLEWIMPQHIAIPEVYFLLVALVMGQPVRLLPADLKLNLDSIWNFMFGVPASQSVTSLAGRVTLCAEAVIALLAMVRAMLNHELRKPEGLPEWLRDYPVTIIQFLYFLYQNMADFMPIFMSADVLLALASTLFPRQGSEVSSGSSTPMEDVKTKNSSHSPMTRSPSKDMALTTHPAKKFVMDFLRVIIVDSLSLPVSGKGPPTIDIILEASPDKCSSVQQSIFQTELLAILMEHLLAADVLIGEQAALPVVPGGSIQNLAPNVYYLAGRIVDKMWQGSFTRDPHDVFEFVIKLIAQAKRRPATMATVSTEGIYHCLNRTILYLLSRSTNAIAEQMSVLDTLHKITSHRNLVFGAGNHELEFFGCLTFCLLQLTSDLKINADVTARTTWVVNPNERPNSAEETAMNTVQGMNLMSVAAKRVWEELYVSKKPAIEEIFKITLPAPKDKAPHLMIVREHVLEAAHKTWSAYIEMEKKSFFKIPWESHNQIQSKIQKVTGGLTRLASRTKVKKDEAVKIKYTSAMMNDINNQVLNQIALVRELVMAQLKHHVDTSQHMQQYLLDEWLKTEAELTRERGLWGPMKGSKLDKWMLDMTEGPCRMRKKMMRNDLFYMQYPYRPEMEMSDVRAIKYRVASSHDSREYYQRFKPQNMFERDNNQQETLPDVFSTASVESMDNENEDFKDIGFQCLHGALMRPNRSISEQDEDNVDNEMDPNNDHGGQVDDATDNQTLMRLLEDKEKVSHMFRCARIQGLDTTEGLLLFGKEHLYVIDGFTILKSREICDIDNLDNARSNQYEPILPSTGSPRRSRRMRQCSKFSYEDIREVHLRRYLLQPIALEVFSSDGRNYLLAFSRKVRNKVYQRLSTVATSMADSAHQSVAGQKRTASVEQTASILSSLIGETSVTQRWVRGEISNFQYLMYLNTLAGRSYNDLMQYPVFPWILADYDSEELDLTNPKTFRDFSKPMGAQSSDRLEQFKKRYREWDDPHGETPPYHYGTHYSSAMIVCSYLVRMEPFTQHFLRLQGGHFDLADRMFHSIKEAWTSASKHNMADVKELIPEFFYLPEFMLNSNNFDLGAKQNGVFLNDVILPPWAKEDPLEFIRVHRQALECEYVSAHMHEWIDLIFGCKQQGPGAVEAVNVFHHLFYEGNVDIYNIDDPLKKNATIGFINNFGQIPKQLFKKAHPAKKVASNRTSSLFDTGPLLPTVSLSSGLFFHGLDNLRPSLAPIKELKAPVGQILQHERFVLAVEQNKSLMPPTYSKYVAWGFADHSLRIGNYDNDKAALVCEAPQNGEVVACVCPNAKLVITAGTSTIVTVWEYKKKQLKVKQSLYGHTEAVTCLAASPAYNVIVSGSRDATAIIWDLSRLMFVRQLMGHSAPVAAVAVNEVTGDIATCAGTWLHVWTINGVQLACVNTSVGRADRMQQILCVAFSQANEWDPQNVIMTGSTDGVARMWSIDYVQVPKEETIVDQPDVPTTEQEKKKVVAKEEEILEQPEDRVKQFVKQMSLSGEYTEENGMVLIKSGSESSLTEDEDDAKDKEVLPVPNIDIEEVDGNKPMGGSFEESMVVVRRRPSASHNNPAFRKSEGSRLASMLSLSGRTRSDSEGRDDPGPVIETNANNPNLLSCTGDSMRTSKSDTSLTDSFVMVNEAEVPSEVGIHKKKNTQNILREGFQWQRQLVFRSKLTMHTAYDRKDNAEPASITCLAVSKDHRTMYVGDARGRVFSWSMAEQPGRADHWLKDEGAESCVGCGVKFSLYERRHHCRNCGQLFCSKCSKFESEISRLRILKPVRVCQGCHATLRSSSTESQS